VRSASTSAAVAALPSPDSQSLFSRIAGVVRHPSSTFEAVAAAPRSAGLLVFLFVVPFATAGAFLNTGIGQQALVDQWERTAIAFGQDVDDAQHARFYELSRRGTEYAAVTALARGPGGAIGVSALLFVIFTAALGGKASYRQVLAVVAHAGVILALQQLIVTPMNYAGESLASPTTLVRFLTMVDEASPVARFLGIIDVFVVWWVIVLAIGIAVLYDRNARTLVAAFVGVYAGAALALAGAMAALGGTV
jgi:hypothetical protein